MATARKGAPTGAEGTAEVGTAAIEFVGTPRRMVAIGAIPDLDGAEARLEGGAAGFLESRRSALRARTRRGTPAMKLRLRPDTPPGDHEAMLHAGERSWPVRVHVLPRVAVKMTPAGLHFTAEPGARATCLAALVNEGNVAVELPRVAGVGIFDDNGIESAFAATYAQESDSLDDFFETFHRRLREAHGGLMKLSLTRGAGSLEPGASAAIEITAQLPEKLARGHRYHGVWNAGFANVAVKVTASK